MLHWIPLTLEQLWASLSSPVSLKDLPAHLSCAHAAIYVVSWWTAATSSHQSTDTCYRYSKTVLRHGVEKVWSCQRMYLSWNCMKSLKGEGTELRARMYANVCMCASPRKTGHVYVCTQVCASAVFPVCTHICTMLRFVHAHVHEPDKRNGRLSASLCVEFWSNVMLMYNLPPPLFVLITERFT